ncbi:MAG: TonB-dependent receptor plug domain-containing protein [Prevotellaceae bacterium]|nr:TonB-dependent receptor plug domain-containing protein [Prevotellaceae bacterium]
MKRARISSLIGTLWLLILSLSTPLVAWSAQRDTVYLQLRTDSAVALQEVTVKGKRTSVANSRYSDLHPIELVTTGGASGDLYRALQNLPGTQIEGESGKLLVRGGSSNETQTYIDGLHVLNPYAARSVNSATRGRYSTFMFSGINLATGGAPLEYGDALSAVLPLETKDESRIHKVGLNASIVGAGGGGTRAFAEGSLSVNVDWQELSLYDRLFPSRTEFEDPYRLLSVATQFRYHPDEATRFKIYAGYDRTDFANYSGTARRLFGFGENNLYLNTTFRRRTSGNWNWYAGAAYSLVKQSITGADAANDHWQEHQHELHVKGKLFRRFSEQFRLDIGAESLVRSYRNRYRLATIDRRRQVTPLIAATFATATYHPIEPIKTELSLRTEYTLPNHRTNLSPRLAVTAQAGGIVWSATAGRYTQLPLASLLTQAARLASEVCAQYMAGIQHESNGRFYKAEIYYKRYSRLALWQAGKLTSDGYGHSRGIDLFLNDRSTVRRLEYQISYTYNLSRRKQLTDTEPTVPQYATRHNAAIALKYSIPRIGAIIGVTNRFSSGRPWHNPRRPGLMNDEVKPYNSLDIGITYLPSPKVVIHASANNVFGRRNLFGRTDDGEPIRASSDRQFYMGVFVTLGKHAAYDVSNF